MVNPKFKDLSGQKFGKWLVIERDLTKVRPTKYWCQCECGTRKVIFAQNLTRGASKQCTNCQSFDISKKGLVGTSIGPYRICSAITDKEKGVIYIVECNACKCIREYTWNVLRRIKNCKYCKTEKLIRNRFGKIGSKIGKLTLVKYLGKGRFLTKCDCGNDYETSSSYLRKSKYTSCGCIIKESKIDNALRLIGYKFGKLKITKFLGFPKGRSCYELKCECGKKIIQDTRRLFSTKSCGCGDHSGLARGSKNHMTILDEQQVSAMKELFKTGLYTGRDLAEMFEISENVVSKIKNGKSWRHVK